MKYPMHAKQLKILDILGFWHIDGFALLSGIVGYKSQSYANLLYLYLTVLFYSIAIYLYFKYMKKDSILTVDFYKELYPMIYKRYWYFTAYFGMYLYLPLINKGISILSKNEYKLVVISTLGILAFWKDYKNPDEDIFNMSNGNSLIWILTLYITGGYIGKYRTDYSGWKKYIYCIICASIYLTSCYLFYKAFNNELNFGKGYYMRKLANFLKQILTERYNSTLKLVQSISFILFFLQIKYNKYLAKVICFFGPLAFSVYLIHINSNVSRNIFEHTWLNEPSNISLKSAIHLVYYKASKVYFTCIFIDLFRYLVFSLLRIKKILRYLENKLKNIII